MPVLETNDQFVDGSQSSSKSLVLAAYRRLRMTGYQGLQNVDCHWQDGKLVLRGTVATYYLKQLAQSLFLADPAIEMLENEITVSREVSGRGFMWQS